MAHKNPMCLYPSGFQPNGWSLTTRSFSPPADARPIASSRRLRMRWWRCRSSQLRAARNALRRDGNHQNKMWFTIKHDDLCQKWWFTTKKMWFTTKHDDLPPKNDDLPLQLLGILLVFRCLATILMNTNDIRIWSSTYMKESWSPTCVLPVSALHQTRLHIIALILKYPQYFQPHTIEMLLINPSQFFNSCSANRIQNLFHTHSSPASSMVFPIFSMLLTCLHHVFLGIASSLPTLC